MKKNENEWEEYQRRDAWTQSQVTTLWENQYSGKIKKQKEVKKYEN